MRLEVRSPGGQGARGQLAGVNWSRLDHVTGPTGRDRPADIGANAVQGARTGSRGAPRPVTGEGTTGEAPSVANSHLRAKQGRYSQNLIDEYKFLYSK